MPMNEAKKKTYDYAIEACKQQMTLAAAILTLTATLVKDIFKTPTPIAIGLMAAVWISLLVSLLFGIRLLLQITSCLGDVNVDDDEAVRCLPRVPGVKISVRVQYGFFFVGLVLLVAFGAANLPRG
jgi:hypothetical protein